jgi:E3 ubiquitin-protein ligase SIAH1
MDSLLNDLLKELECPVCMEYMTAPIHMCESGHSICTSCRQKLHNCPTCRKTLTNSRNFALEALTGKEKYPCKYYEFGCEELFSPQQIATHKAKCRYKPFKCPLKNCSWEGPLATIEYHIKSEHAELGAPVTITGTHATKLTQYNMDHYQIIFSLGEVFLWFTTKRRHLYSCVLYVGPKEKASTYRYRFTISKRCGTGSVSACEMTNWYLNNMDEIFQKWDCAVFDHELLKKCTIKGELPLELEIFSCAP